jgi:hypothetical protein
MLAMKKLAVLAVAAALTSAAGAKVWTSVYRCDGTTPLASVDPNHPNVYRDIMAGTRLVIVVSSDAKGAWFGGLLLSWDDSVYGELVGIGYNQKTRNYDGSCLAAAGPTAFTRIFQIPPKKIGLQFNTQGGSVPGDWFVVDYRAEQVGPCDVGLYDLSASANVPIETVHFTHVPSRDFNGDGIVDFKDFALLSSRWHSGAAPDPNRADAAFDLNSDGHLDIGDLALFSEYWLERTECKPTADPNNPSLNS